MTISMKHTLVFFFITFFNIAELKRNYTSLNSITHLKSTCTTLDCNNGYCKETDQGPVCICDEGFLGTNCDQQGSDFYHRTQLMPGLADPNVLAINDDFFVLMGTADGLVLPIYQSTDLINFQLNRTYNPSAVDSANDYCSLWAPNLVKNGTGFDLRFVAQRVSKGSPCPAAGEDVTTFYANAPDANFIFGVPVLVGFGGGAPNGRTAAGCNDDGCLKTIRIDPAVVDGEGERWYFYVWFQGGNNIASIKLSAPTNVIVNAGPAMFPIPPSDENINEAPEVFLRNGSYYLFFSTAFFNSQYGMSYVMSTSLADLTRNRTVRMHSLAQHNSAGNLVQSHGSNSIVHRRGQFFNVFHQGIFDNAGKMTGRSTFKQRIAFRPDGSIQTLNTVDLRWTRIPSYQYSLDVVMKDGTSVGPCIAVDRIKDALGITFDGVCPDGGDRLVDKGDIVAFRLFYSNDGTWKDFITAPYDEVSDQMAIFLPGGITEQIAIRWNERVTGTKYSLDVLRSDGTWISPCVGDAAISNSIEYLFDSNCRTASISVEPRNITSIRMCSAINDDWSKAICGAVAYDGRALHVYVTI